MGPSKILNEGLQLGKTEFVSLTHGAFDIDPINKNKSTILQNHFGFLILSMSKINKIDLNKIKDSEKDELIFGYDIFRDIESRIRSILNDKYELEQMLEININNSFPIYKFITLAYSDNFKDSRQKNPKFYEQIFKILYMILK